MYRNKAWESRKTDVMLNDHMVKMHSFDALLAELLGNSNSPSYIETMEKKYENINSYSDLQNLALQIVNRRELQMGIKN